MLQNVVLCNIKPCSPGASVSFCRGLVRWWLHVLHDHVCICFLSSCRCNKKAGGTWIFEGYISNTSTTSPASNRTCLQWETGLQGFACSTAWHATIGNNSRKATSLISYKTAFFAHKVVSDWHVWKPLILMQWWAMGDTPWAKRLHQAGRHQASPGSLARCWPKGSWAVAHPKRRTNQIQHAKRCVAIPQDISRQQRDLMWE